LDKPANEDIRINDDIRSWKDWVLEDPQGILYAEMVHFIDLALWLNKGRPTKVFVEGSNRGNFTIVILFDDGSMTTMHHTMVGHFDYPKELFEFTARNFSVAMQQHIEVCQSGFDDEPEIQTFPYGESCEWASQQGVAGYLRESASERRNARAEGRAPRWLNVNKGHREHLERFMDCIEGIGPNPCDARSAMPVIGVALRLLKSVKEERPLLFDSSQWY